MVTWPRISPQNLRLISSAWAIWSWLTALAYVGREPSSLDPVAVWLPAGLPITWACIAILFTLGAVLPRRGRLGRLARLSATIGTALLACMLAGFTFAYGFSGGRGWVSAKNYAALTAVAFVCARLFGKGHGGH